ncbi:acyltransferase [Dyadobacter sp. NIV53]|uniref:acyltransferase family protein n=1 Tax=Dyadobacter sp. NIV53 TaxID=2861765 RepID=UPI001C884C8E|nr:acyltransferase [Dyadobacter sp. NIV53]
MHTNNFHFLRFVAAVLVIFGHSYPLAGFEQADYIQEITSGLFPSAHIGVCIFFSISGYLIAKSLVQSKNYFHFFWKRLVRIMPGLIVAVLFTIFVIGPLATSLTLSEYFTNPATYAYAKVIKLFPEYNDSLPGVFKTLPSMLINGSLWTLAYEVSCYMISLAAYIVLGKRIKFAALFVFLSLWGSFFLWHDYLINYHVPIRFIHLNLSDLLDFGLYFLAGSLLYFFSNLVQYNWILLISLFAVFMLSYFMSSKWDIIPLKSIVWVRYIFLPYAIIFFGFQKGRLNHFGSSGDISYGLYIYSFPLQQLIVLYFGAGNISIAEMFLYSFGLTLPFAWFSWRYVEAPGLRLKNIIK